ncbi:ATP-binding cassette domain-containing protein [Treponema sp. OMZ 788]|uniref:ATP-binding cassette domain-containing protein n=1 Tax=Treponema sp. OMZ 788 TaxID=2563664 RepID=UPI0020A5C6F9|nr:ATP-binding cassette domain-containing protein [Treponema sp. OMZ 788]UTC64884.1 ATP-binding cassette domain-containing protein [Treponema sp. OMZ 788]
MHDIKLKSISKSYSVGDEKQIVLDDLSHNFASGKISFIFGPSGCGKSSLLNIIAGIDKNYSGEVLYKGETIQDYDKFRRENISFIFQDSNLIPHQNLLKNIVIALHNGIENKEELAINLLKKVGLSEHIYKKPSMLSTGERQRASIARALARNTDILLCDEPTGSLDETTKIEICDLILEVFKGKTIIFVSHDEELARIYADEILTIDNKKLKSIKEKTQPESDSQIERRAENKIKPEDSSFKNRFYINILSEKLKLFNSLQLLVIILGIFIFSIGSFKAVSYGIDQYLYGKYKADKITLSSAGMSLNALLQNIEDYNGKFKEKIYGLTLGLPSSIRLEKEKLPVFINMMQEKNKASFSEDIIAGRFPENPKEILFSKYYALKLLYTFDNLIDIKNISAGDLFNRLKELPISYKAVCKFAGKVPKDSDFYDEDLKIVGIIDDLRYISDFDEGLFFEMKKFNEDMDVSGFVAFMRNIGINLNYPFYLGEEEISDSIYVNENIYFLEEEFTKYLSKIYLSETAYKFTYFDIFIDENLDTRKKVHTNYLLFKSIFKGSDNISLERKSYLDDIYGYKLSIIFTLIILGVIAVLSAYNGLKNLITAKRKDIGIYRSLGYTTKELKKMFIKEGLIISFFVCLASVFFFMIISLFLGEYFINLLDCSRIVNLKSLFNFDIFSLSAAFLIIILIIIISISSELKKTNIDELIR